MEKNDHRQQECLNCQQPLEKTAKYCHNCGQENNDFRLSVGELLFELFSNIFNLDSRLAHSIYPFLLKPGFLPKVFLEGKRRFYVHPVRFYLFSSLFFFFAFSKEINPVADQVRWSLSDSGEKKNSMSPHEMSEHLRATQIILQQASEDGQVDSLEGLAIEKQLNLIDTNAIFYNRSFSRHSDVMLELSLSTNEDVDSVKSAWEDYVGPGAKRQADEGVLRLNDLGVSWDKLVEVWLKDPNMTPDRLLDSLSVENRSWVEIGLAKQALKYSQFSEPKLWVRNVLDNIPLMMFILLPLYASLLKFFYIRSSFWYIDHLVFTLHIHAFIFIVLGVALLFASLKPEVVMGVGALITTYSYIMFKRFYGQGIIKTFIKFSFTGTIYLIMLLIAALLEMVISFLLV